MVVCDACVCTAYSVCASRTNPDGICGNLIVAVQVRLHCHQGSRGSPDEDYGGASCQAAHTGEFDLSRALPFKNGRSGLQPRGGSQQRYP